MMMEVEGGTETWCLRLLRHEMGHVLNHAYLLEKDNTLAKIIRTDLARIFRKLSRAAVQHANSCATWKATMPRAIPEEDFAETVAIWLTPDLEWRQQYRGWKALQKFEYVDELMQQARGKTAAGFFQSQDQRRVPPPFATGSPLQKAAAHLRPGISRLFRRRSKKAFRRRSRVAQR